MKSGFHPAERLQDSTYGLQLARRESVFYLLKTAIEPLLAPEIYRTVLDVMTDQIKAIKMDRVAISFTPRHVAYETETNKVFVSGEL